MLRLTLLLLLMPFFLFAQNGNSPYSNIGLGETIPEEFVYNTGMGGITAGVFTPFHINLNPAFLPYNRYTTFDLGLAGEYKRLSSKDNSVTDGNGNLRYIAFAFPIAKKYTISVGIKPLTRVSYNYSQVNKFGAEDSVLYTFKGDGGINNVFLSQGVQVTKSLGIGLKLAYNFGAIEKRYDSYIYNIQQDFIVENVHQTNYRGVTIAPSVGYVQKLNKDWYLNAGIMYEFGNKWGYTDLQTVEKLGFSGNTLDFDTLQDEVEGKISHPSSLNVGVSIEKQYKWLIGVDYKFQDWSDFNSIDNSESLESVSTISLGGQYIPNLNAVKGYLNRVVFRAGVYYTQNKYAVNTQELNDIGGSLGFDFPVGRLSFLNIAFSAGKRGDKNSNILEENYYRVNVGVTLNDRWFVRSKFD